MTYQIAIKERPLWSYDFMYVTDMSADQAREVIRGIEYGDWNDQRYAEANRVVAMLYTFQENFGG